MGCMSCGGAKSSMKKAPTSSGKMYGGNVRQVSASSSYGKPKVRISFASRKKT